MEIIAYPSPLPAAWTSPGSFVDRNPNFSYLSVAGDRAVLIDACSDLAAVLKDLRGRRLHLDALLITHYHQDHTFALKDWLKEYPELPIGVHPASLGALAAAAAASSAARVSELGGVRAPPCGSLPGGLRPLEPRTQRPDSSMPGRPLPIPRDVVVASGGTGGGGGAAARLARPSGERS